MRKSNDKKRFVYYLLYAWGLPAIITLVTFSFDHYEILSDEWRTHFGDNTIWFPRKYDIMNNCLNCVMLIRDDNIFDKIKIVFNLQKNSGEPICYFSYCRLVFM